MFLCYPRQSINYWRYTSLNNMTKGLSRDVYWPVTNLQRQNDRQTSVGTAVLTLRFKPHTFQVWLKPHAVFSTRGFRKRDFCCPAPPSFDAAKSAFNKTKLRVQFSSVCLKCPRRQKWEDFHSLQFGSRPKNAFFVKMLYKAPRFVLDKFFATGDLKYFSGLMV